MPWPRWLSLPDKDQLAGRFHRHPVLEKLVLVLLYDWRFRLVVGFLALVFFLMVAAVLRVWRVTPPGLEPVVRISLLDRLQAQSLRRAAEAALAANRIDEGLNAWRTAVSNNPGDTALIRDYLRRLAEFGQVDKHGREAVRQASWLFTLTGTNLLDAEVVARTYLHFAYDSLVVDLFRPREPQLTPPLLSLYAKALFNTRDIDAFARIASQLSTAAPDSQDHELDLYREAYRAGWTEGDSAARAQTALVEARVDPTLGYLAHRLQLVVSERRRDPVTYRASLDFLAERRAAPIRDHLIYLQVLESVGRRPEAVDYLRGSFLRPSSADEVVWLGRAYFELGLGEEARKVLNSYLPEYPFSESLLLSYANLLETQGEWSELMDLAVLLRNESNPARAEVIGFSYYLEGLAQHRRGNLGLAQAAFASVMKFPPGGTALWGKMAVGLQALGYPNEAQEILLTMRNGAETNPDYWYLVARTAHDLRDASLLTFAMGSAYKLRPNDPAILQDYAAALLTARILPADAVQLTLRLLERSPRSAAARINHASALVQNHRASDARTLLETITTNRLAEPDRNSLQLVWFEVLHSEGRWAEAAEAQTTINRQLLFPPESRWLNEAFLRVQQHLTNRPPPTPSP